MTPFTVEWTAMAEGLLADVWLRAVNPSEVAAAQMRVDAALARNPLTAGYERHEGLWKLVDPPLSVLYRVNEVDRIVTVEAVGYIP